jgi:fatty acid synthase, animal type
LTGAVSVVKILIAMQSGVIPPNLHFKTPNPLIPALVDGRLKVVTEPMKWNSTLAGVNCFGFGGQNSHLILRGNPNIRQEAVTDVRLFLYMGRTEEAARNALNYANRYPDDPYVPYLLMQSAYAKPASMPFRGYTITNSAQAVTVVERVSVEQKPVWWIFRYGLTFKKQQLSDRRIISVGKEHNGQLWAKT